MDFFRRVKKLSPLEGYNLWAESYHEEANPIKKLSDEFILESLPELSGKLLLDAGCGTGRFCMTAVEQRALIVKGIDLSPAMIAEAKKNCPTGRFECADLSTAALERYDVIICGLVLGHIDNFEPVLNKLINALNPKGHLILTDFHPYQTIMKAKRTFSHDKKTFEIEHTLHALDEYFTILRNSNIQVVSFKEPFYQDTPVIFGIHGVAA